MADVHRDARSQTFACAAPSGSETSTASANFRQNSGRYCEGLRAKNDGSPSKEHTQARPLNGTCGLVQQQAPARCEVRSKTGDMCSNDHRPAIRYPITTHTQLKPRQTTVTQLLTMFPMCGTSGIFNSNGDVTNHCPSVLSNRALCLSFWSLFFLSSIHHSRWCAAPNARC